MPQPFNPSKGAFATAFITSLVQGIQAAQERNLQESAQQRKTEQQALEGLVKYGQEIGNDEITSLGISGLIELGEGKTNFLGVLQKSKTLPQARALVSRLSGARRPTSEAIGELNAPQEKPMEGLKSRPVTGLLDLVSGSGGAPSVGAPPSMALPATSPTEKGAPPMAPPQVPVMPEDLAFEQNQMGAAAPVKPEINIGAPTPAQGTMAAGKPLDDYTAALKILSQDKYALDPHMAVVRRIYQTHAALGEPIANAREAAILALNPEVGALKRAREAGTTRLTLADKQIAGRENLEDKKLAGKKDLLDITNWVSLTPAEAKNFGIDPGDAAIVRMDKTVFKEWSKQEGIEKQQAGAGARASLRASEISKLQKITTVDSDGNKIIVFARPKEGETFIAPSGAAEESKEKQADRILHLRDQLLTDLQKPEISAKLGPLLGRGFSVTQWLGAPDPVVQEWAAGLSSWLAMQPAIHGFRGQRALQEFEKIAGGPFRTPEALAASIRGLGKASEEFSRTKPKGGEPGTTKAKGRFEILSVK